MSPIPWRAILTHGPAIVSAARLLLANQSSKVNERHHSLEARLEHLEKASVESARLLEQLAEQLHAITLAQQEAQRRLRIAMITSAAAAALSIVALVYFVVTNY